MNNQFANSNLKMNMMMCNMCMNTMQMFICAMEFNKGIIQQ